ncbi:hypothetical protein HOY82DRAFT_553861, partial [Tuber indicum]
MYFPFLFSGIYHFLCHELIALIICIHPFSLSHFSLGAAYFFFPGVAYYRFFSGAMYV